MTGLKPYSEYKESGLPWLARIRVVGNYAE